MRYAHAYLNKPTQIMTKEDVKALIESGVPCYYKYGLWDTMGSAKPITKEKALELLPNYHFETGFYMLIVPEDRSYVKFKELSETDLW